jgi:hypothetical protein
MIMEKGLHRSLLFFVSLVLAMLAMSALSVPANAETLLTAANASGTPIQSFYTNDTVYVTGNVTGPAQTLDIYIVYHKTTWTNGTNLRELSLGYTIVQANNSGGFPATLLWDNPDMGSYDIVADVNRDEIYNSSIDFVENV